VLFCFEALRGVYVGEQEGVSWWRRFAASEGYAGARCQIEEGSISALFGLLPDCRRY